MQPPKTSPEQQSAERLLASQVEAETGLDSINAEMLRQL